MDFKQLAAIFVAVLLAAGLALLGYDRLVLAPRLEALGESERVSLRQAREEARDIATTLDAEVDRSVDDARAALDAQAAEQARRSEAAHWAAKAEMEAGFRRASLAEVLARGQMPRMAISEYYVSMGEWPTRWEQAGLGDPADFAGGAVASVALEPGGVIVLRTSDLVARGGAIRLVPSVRGGVIHWQCRASDYPHAEAAPECGD